MEPGAELGEFPYQIMAAVVSGKRPALPDTEAGAVSMPAELLVSLVQSCWNEDPSTRPDFVSILAELSGIERLLGDGNSLSSIN